MLLQLPVLTASAGLFPDPSAGLALAAGLRFGRAFVLLEGNLWLPQRWTSERRPDSGARVDHVEATLRGCWAFEVDFLELAPCVAGSVQHVWARGEGPRVVAETASATSFAAGLGGQARVPLASWVAVFFLAEAQVGVSRPFVSIEDIGRVGQLGHAAIEFSAGTECRCPANPGPALSNVEAYTAASSPKKRLVGITGAGHLSVTDLCQKNMQGRNAVEEAQADGVCGVETAVIIGLPALNDCGPGTLPWMKGVEIVNYATTAAIDETLHCQNRDAAFSMLRARFPEVGDFRHTP